MDSLSVVALAGSCVAALVWVVKHILTVTLPNTQEGYSRQIKLMHADFLEQMELDRKLIKQELTTLREEFLEELKHIHCPAWGENQRLNLLTKTDHNARKLVVVE